MIFPLAFFLESQPSPLMGYENLGTHGVLMIVIWRLYVGYKEKDKALTELMGKSIEFMAQIEMMMERWERFFEQHDKR